MVIQHHDQTNFRTLVKTEQKNNPGCMKSCALMCKKGHTQMRHLIAIPRLVEGMSYHKKSLYIVFKMPETIAIYSNTIAQHY